MTGKRQTSCNVGSVLLWAFVGASLLAGAASSKQAPHPAAPPAASPVPSGLPAAQPLDGVMVASIERQLTEKLDDRYEKMLREAKEADDRLREHMTLVLDGATCILTALTVVLLILAGVGIREIRQLGQERRKAAEETKKVQELRRDIDQHIVVHVKRSIETAWSGLVSQFDRLPQLGNQRQLAGSAPEPISAEMRLAYEEADILVVLGDKLDALGGAEKATSYFNRLAVFWWEAGDWARGTARSKRAIEISPASYSAHSIYAMGLMDRSSRLSKQEIGDKLLLLAEAERLLLKARQLRPAEGPHVLHKLGWIYDEEGNLPRAAESYRLAMRGELTPEIRGRYGYDLACTLCKAGQLQEALDTLRTVIDADDNRRLAAIDPDFENLRRSALSDRFAELLRTA